MERMAQNGNIEMSQAFFMEVWNGYERSKDLEEENRNLRDYVDNLDSENDNQAIEIEELKKENRNLKSDLAYERTMLDNVRAEYKSLQDIVKKLKEEVEQLKNKRIFNSTEYDLITLTSTTPQWELRRK